MSAVIESGTDGLMPMRPEDLNDVMVIETAVYPHPWTQGIFADCIKVGYSCWVYRRQAELHGYCVMAPGPGEAHILTLCVHPDHQRQGIARMIMDFMLRLAQKRQAQTMFLEVRPSNIAAIELYRSMGFIDAGRRPNYYPDESNTREDALIMTRALD
ncbi:Ribosomal-protein-S18p-alanine acetyltransferase [hydrothermal vent metagenome]|uniref:Ribosomal-protein-S18p-alanine acetyltransferase n=1 Tax=hydrothermal vent metagenome TaxID=652676 RepID=A0A3B1BHK4_9ZZZZ